MRTCAYCNGPIPEEKRRGTKYCQKRCAGYASRLNCRERRDADTRAWSQAHPEQVRDRRYRNAYGIGIEDYNRMLKEQGGVCAICRKEDVHQLSVDHDHKTGKIRGLLCQRCNNGLGCMNDDPDRLLDAVRYLWIHA